MITDMRNQSRRCTVSECNKLLAQKDPHNRCRNCRVPCDLENRCPDCIQLSADQVTSINQAYTKMAAKRVRQAKWARRNRVQKMNSSDEMAQRLRALESVLLLQSTQGTSLETLLLAEGIPLPARTLNRADDQQPSTSTGTYTRQGPLQTRPRDEQVYTPTGSIGEVDENSGDDTTHWIGRDVNSQLEVINSRQDDATSQRRQDDVDSQRRHKEVNVDDLRRRVDVDSQEVNVDDRRQRIDVDSQHKRVNVDDLHKKVNVDDLHRRVDVNSQEVNVDHRRVDIDSQEVNVDDRRRRIDVDNHHKEVNVDDQHRRVDVDSQHKQVNVDDRHRRYDVDRQHKDVNIDDRSRRDDVDYQVNIDDQRKDVNVDDRRRRVDVDSQHNGVNVDVDETMSTDKEKKSTATGMSTSTIDGRESTVDRSLSTLNYRLKHRHDREMIVDLLLDTEEIDPQTDIIIGMTDIEVAVGSDAVYPHHRDVFRLEPIDEDRMTESLEDNPLLTTRENYRKRDLLI